MNENENCSRTLPFLGGINCRFYRTISPGSDQVHKETNTLTNAAAICRQGQDKDCIVSGTQFPPRFVPLFPIPIPVPEGARLAVQTEKFNALSGIIGQPLLDGWQLAITRPRNHNRTELFAIPHEPSPTQARPTPSNPIRRPSAQTTRWLRNVAPSPRELSTFCGVPISRQLNLQLVQGAHLFLQLYTQRKCINTN